MALANPKRHITATTIDKKGIEFTNELIKNAGVENQIATKIEDVTEPMSYSDNSFDFVYSRLCLHYIDDAAMKNALREIARVLKEDGKVFIVLQNMESFARAQNAEFIPKTGMTRYTRKNGAEVRYRRFYSQDTFREVAKGCGLEIVSMSEYMERTCSDYARQIPSSKESGMLEVVLVKKKQGLGGCAIFHSRSSLDDIDYRFLIIQENGESRFSF